MTVKDPTAALKIYEDKNTASGNVTQVLEHFCLSRFFGSQLVTEANSIPSAVFLLKLWQVYYHRTQEFLRMQRLTIISQPSIHQDSQVPWKGVFEGDAV